MKTKKIDLQGLFNQEWRTYLVFVIKAIKQIGADKLSLVAILPLLEAIAARAAEAMEFIRKSEFTRRCDELDEKRDRLIAPINNFVRSFLQDADPAMRDAATDLMIVIDHYAGMAEENRDQESQRIINFVSELRSNHAPKITALEGLERRLLQLEEANNEYIKLQDDRTFADAEKTDIRMSDVRREGDKYLRVVWNLVDALLLTAPTADLETFAAQLNVENQNVRSKLAARKS
jgi:hypothetical protein